MSQDQSDINQEAKLTSQDQLDINQEAKVTSQDHFDMNQEAKAMSQDQLEIMHTACIMIIKTIVTNAMTNILSIGHHTNNQAHAHHQQHHF